MNINIPNETLDSAPFQCLSAIKILSKLFFNFFIIKLNYTRKNRQLKLWINKKDCILLQPFKASDVIRRA